MEHDHSEHLRQRGPEYGAQPSTSPMRNGTVAEAQRHPSVKPPATCDDHAAAGPIAQSDAQSDLDQTPNQEPHHQTSNHQTSKSYLSQSDAALDEVVRYGDWQIGGRCIDF